MLWAWDAHNCPVMSYRRLMTLIGGLGPNSLVLNIQAQRTKPDKTKPMHHGQDVRVIDADENPEAFVAWLKGLVTKQPNTPEIQA